MLILILVSLIFSPRVVNPTCECPPWPSVAVAVTNSTAVFSGEVIAEEYRYLKKGDPNGPGNAQTLIVKLKVNCWWKGNGAAEVELYTSVRKYANGITSAMAEDFQFRKGESYLVYASGSEGKFSTSDCTRTQKLADADEDLRELGQGREAEKKKIPAE